MSPKQFFSFLLLIIFLLPSSAWGQDTTGLALPQSKFEKLMKRKNVMILDVRTPEEYQSGYIGNAVNYNVLDSVQFISTLSTLQKNKKYLLYCKSGRRSGKALVMMKNQGFKKVFHLRGGITDWKGKLHKPE